MVDRYKQAATTPFHSMHMGQGASHDEQLAVFKLQSRLESLADNWPLLPTALLSRPTPFSPPQGFGPFFFGLESPGLGGGAFFGRQTDLAVRKFQTQAGIEVDGKAGISTLRELDKRAKAIAQMQGRSDF